MIDCHASATNHADHLFPIWCALDESERGSFTVSPAVVAHAARAGVRVRVGKPDTRSRSLILLASWADVRLCGQRGFVMVEHGTGQGYTLVVPDDTQPDPSHSCRMVLMLCPNEMVAVRNRVHHAHTRIETVGSARVESLAVLRARSVIGNCASVSSREISEICEVTRDLSVGVTYESSVTASAGTMRPVRSRGSSESERGHLAVVAFAWHWASPLHPCARSAFPYWSRAVAELAAMSDVERGFAMLGHGHPREWPKFRRFYAAHGIGIATATEVIERAAVLVFDNTSFGFEGMACGIPVVLLDAPWFDTHGEEFGLRFWAAADAGLRVGSGDPADLHAAITRTLIADPCKERRQEVVRQTYPLIAGATAASVAAVRSVL